MHLSVVIVTHRADHLLQACLDSVRPQRPDTLLVVVSNEHRPVDAPALQLLENVGYARAANAGVAAVPGDVLLLNDDTVLHPDCLAALRAAWRGRGVYQPRIELADGSGMDNFGHGIFPDGFVWARGRHRPYRPFATPPAAFSGAAVLFARSVWDELGGFDVRFGSFAEDVDLSLRMMRRAIPLVPVPDAIVAHHLGATFGRTSPEKVFNIERNRMRAAVRSLPVTALLSMPAWTGARYLLFAALAGMDRGPGQGVGEEARRAAVSGLLQGLKDMPAWWEERAKDRPHWQRGEREMWQALWQGRVRMEDVWHSPS